MEVKVSIIIPVYGVELFLERAVDSALGQTLAEKEIILVDDGSPDACPEICERYAREYPGLVRVLHQENQGLGMARNAGGRLGPGGVPALSGLGTTPSSRRWPRPSTRRPRPGTAIW